MRSCQKPLGLEAEAGWSKVMSENSWGIGKFEQESFLSWEICLSFVPLLKIDTQNNFAWLTVTCNSTIWKILCTATLIDV